MNGCYIPVVCENCKDGMMDVLFEGTADTVNQVYKLSDSILEYRQLIIEVYWRYKSLNRFGKHYVNVISPEFVKEAEGIETGPVYGMYVNPILINNKIYRVGVSFVFKSASELCIDGIEEGNPGTVKVCISKIYGVK